MNHSTQQQMFSEIESKEIFQQAQQYAFDYLEQVFERNVYPTEEALADLTNFDEPFPAQSRKLRSS